MLSLVIIPLTLSFLPAADLLQHYCCNSLFFKGVSDLRQLVLSSVIFLTLLWLFTTVGCPKAPKQTTSTKMWFNLHTLLNIVVLESLDQNHFDACL